MLSFENDYSEGGHPAILKAMENTNFEQNPGYGTDQYSARAADSIRDAISCPDAGVFFLVGGTQTNMTVIDAVTPQYAGVVSADSGHINVHEAGAVEATGHKVLTLPEHQGKMDADELDAFCKNFYRDGNHEHMVFPEPPISPSQRNMAPSTHSATWWQSPRSAASMTYACSWTAPVWAMPWRQQTMMSL